MSYRTIDHDKRLLLMAKRFWDEEQLTRAQLYWVLESEGYTRQEIKNAIIDYYIIHKRSDMLFYAFMVPFLGFVILWLLVARLWQMM